MNITGNITIPYEKLFECIAEEVYVFLQDGTILYANQSAREQTGYGDKIKNVNMIDLFPKTLTIETSGIEYIMSDQGKEKELPSFCYRENRTCYPVSLKMAQEGQLCILIVRNLSELMSSQRQEKIVKEELEYANSMKNEFLANITHELRTPVNGIKGLAEVLSESGLTAKQEETIHIIRRCCDNMNDMISQILDYSKLAAGKLIITENEFDFIKFIQQAVMLHESAILKKGLKLSVNIASDVPKRVIGDELRIGQVINNLLSNAVKFTSTGQITLEVVNTFESESYVELFFMVIDTGIGIAKDEMDKLFLSFSQVDGSITRKFGGTGLGLAISKRLVEMMNGSIHVTSEKGAGSRFSFSVRLKQCKIGKADKIAESEQMEPVNQTQVLEIPKEKETERKSIVNKQTDIENLLERLNLSVELELWEKAEYYSTELKKLIPRDLIDLWRQVFRIELATRKEAMEETRKQIAALNQMLSDYIKENQQ